MQQYLVLLLIGLTLSLGAAQSPTGSAKDSGNVNDNDGAQEATGGGGEIKVVGLISLIVFYLIVLGIGLWAGWSQRKRTRAAGATEDQETVMLAGRNIGLFVGVLTMGGKHLILLFEKFFFFVTI